MDAGEILAASRIVPVATIHQVDQGEALAECLCDAGMSSIEITLRSDAALATIERIAHKLPQMTIGVGSIRTAGQMKQAHQAGAQFAVSPGCSETLLSMADELAMPFVPGATTPSEMIALLDRGYRLQKFFPAQQAGGLNYLKAIAKPLPEVRFFPTGGIDATLAAEYLAFDKVACIGGSWFISDDKVAAGDFQSISNSVKQILTELSIFPVFGKNSLTL